jgi:hypothetical protein
MFGPFAAVALGLALWFVMEPSVGCRFFAGVSRVLPEYPCLFALIYRPVTTALDADTVTALDHCFHEPSIGQGGPQAADRHIQGMHGSAQFQELR